MILTLSGTKIWRNLLGLKQNPKVVRLWRWKFAFEVFCASGQKRKKILMMLRDEKIFAFVCVSHNLTLSKISFDWKRNFNSTCFERKKIWRHFLVRIFSNEILKGGHLFIVRENAFPPEIGDPFSRLPNTHLAEQ